MASRVFYAHSLQLLKILFASAVIVLAEYEFPVATNATTRASQTLGGVLNYFWESDPTHKNIKFLFSCELGATASGIDGQCSCYSTGTCVNCYRWWTGVMVESVASYGILMNTTNHSQLPATVFAHSPYNANWDLCTYIDDFLWYGIAYLRVYEWLKVMYSFIHSYEY